jgi:hypothetical protein
MTRRVGTVFIGFMLLIGTAAGPVAAASPVNDSVSGAIALTSFPVISTVDMTETTLDPEDPWCDAVTGNVWYRYTATAEESLTVAIPDIEPATRVCVLPDSIGAGTYSIIFPGETRTLILDQGRTYYIELAVVEFATSATLDLARGPAPFDLQLVVDTSVADRVTGAAIIGGTITCSEPATFADLNVRVIQPAGKKRTVDGSVFVQLPFCGPSPTRWQVAVYGSWTESGVPAFVPGTASLYTAAGAGIPNAFDQDVSTTSIRLRSR